MGTLEVRSLSRIRNGVLTFDEVSFTVPDGGATAIVGPALAGKTSLLRVIAGVERSDGGDVLLDGQSLLRLPPERRRLGFLFDDLALFEHMTARENVMFGLRMRRRSRVDRLRRTDDVLGALGLAGHAHRKPRDLSPGERKRLAFARAVAPEPSLLLLDEPTAGVEEAERDVWRQELAEALRALQVTTLIATSDMRDAVMLADDLVLLSEGQVLQTGAVARVLQGPASIEAATLAGYVPLVRGDVAEGFVVEPGVGSIAFPAEFPLRHHAAVMAHPAALFGVPGGSGLGSGVSGTLVRARPDGPVYLLEVRLDERVIALRWEWDLTPPPPGSLVEIAVRPGTLRFFNDTPAPRVRGAEPPRAEEDRFATLAPRVVAGTDAPGPQASPPPVVETNPDTPEPKAASTSETSSEPLGSATPASEGATATAKPPSKLPVASRASSAPVPTPLPDSRARVDQAPPSAGSPPPGTTAEGPTGIRPPRLTPPSAGSDGAPASPHGPAPTAPPPPGS